MSFGTACALPLAWGAQLVLFVDLAMAGEVGIIVYDGVHVGARMGCAAGASCLCGCGNVELEAVAGVAGIVVLDGVLVALAWGVQLVLFVGLAVAGVVRLVMWDVLQDAARMALGVLLVSGWGYLRGLVYMYWLRTWSLKEWHIDQ